MEVAWETPIDESSITVQYEHGFLSFSHKINFIAVGVSCAGVELHMFVDVLSALEMVVGVDQNDVVFGELLNQLINRAVGKPLSGLFWVKNILQNASYLRNHWGNLFSLELVVHFLSLIILLINTRSDD